jgi:NADH:ubiquinone oxidoreductase subunit E
MHMTHVKEKGITVENAVKNALELYGEKKEELIPILLKVNTELGFLPNDALRTISTKLHIPQSQLYSVATFYKMLFMHKMGRHVVKFCESAPCHVAGGRQVWSALKDELKLQPGETSPDGKWTLVTVSCLGLCASGPVMLVDEDVYGNLTPENLSVILAKYQ